MRKLVMSMAIIAMVAFAATAFATIAGSAHDFSSNSVSSAGSTACGGCHKPHNAGTLIPLWNDGNTDNSSYLAYTSPTDTLNTTAGAGTGTVSEACMACHDGMVDSAGLSMTASATTTVTTGLTLNTTNGQYQHPIDITYYDNNTTQGTETVLKPFAQADAVFKFYGTSNDKVQCATCHNPHGTDDGTGKDYVS
ncbi:multiheme C-type cytochrome [Flexistipes sinusarabici DSM 4947]|uniref:Multiheme C-type cytochrome n=1 Tax=Flexistipes sinusarabici (strain ATCC 49648 / DSM 4947 / MAS 10) TaxID=717231 RepID=F8E4S0_FLESM|nr:hypothetical protein [Flexistipes sinusarabici]AEI15628.1 multiheme C-type cytochrome [Flexistipes sinusarabici DSM 4947]